MIALLIFLSIIFYTVTNVAASRASASGDPNFAGTVTNLIGTVVPLILFLIYRQTDGYSVTKIGTIWSLVAGLGIGLFTLTITQLFFRGANASYVLPMIFGTSIALIGVIGVALLKEKTNTTSVIGIAFISLGVIVLALGRYKLDRGTL